MSQLVKSRIRMKVKMVASKLHSRTHSPSKSSLYFVCPASTRFIAMFQEEPGPEAIYGTETHTLGETLLRQSLRLYDFDNKEIKPIEETIKGLTQYDDEMLKLAEGYANKALSLIESERKRIGHDPIVFIEETLNMNWLMEGMVGTLDLGVIADDVMTVLDLKTGRSKVDSWVSKEDDKKEPNSQLGLYALGLYHSIGKLYPIKKVRIIIVQERINHISEYELTLDELLEWERNVVIPAIDKTLEPNPTAVPNKGCKWCPGKDVCAARRNANLGLYETSKKQMDLLTDEEIDVLLPKLDDLIKFAEDIKAHAIKRMLDGYKFKKHKLVYSRVTRSFSDNDTVAKILMDNGYEAYSKPKLLGITEIQKQLGKAKLNELLGEYITTTKGSITIATSDDEREEVNIESYKEDKSI